MESGLRPFTPEDYPALAALLCAVDPEYPVTVEELKYRDANRDAKCRHARWIYEKSGEVVASGGYGQETYVYHPQKFWISLSVHPQQRRQGIGREFYDHVLRELEAFEPLTVGSYVRSDRTDSVGFLERRGFQEVMRDWESRLDVAALRFQITRVPLTDAIELDDTAVEVQVGFVARHVRGILYGEFNLDRLA